MTSSQQSAAPYVIAALYKFFVFDDFEEKQTSIIAFCTTHNIKGTLLLAREGINGTVAGSREAIDALLSYLKSELSLDELAHKESYDEDQPFYRLKIKLKKEIVTMGIDWIDPNESVGTYIEPAEWNALISDPEVVVIDTRNDYEIEIGTFRNAINPKTESFREFPEYVAKNLDPKKNKKIAMFCTGGIRCEKSTAYMKGQGFEEVYHLKGGVLKYLEDVPKDETLWEGECFVFDNRVAVDHDLEPGSYDMCHGCRFPINDEDKKSDKFVEGVSCARCHDSLSHEQKSRFEERQKQINLAKSRGQKHIGVTP